ncbi:hypothetical protein ACG2K1_04815 [Neisseria sp. 23W00296]|uniref:hypothetical protein n=1 Tax=unclassified Neisseria TaxID=2623750 RepID=UPI003757390E
MNSKRFTTPLAAALGIATPPPRFSGYLKAQRQPENTEKTTWTKSIYSNKK